MGNIEQSNNNNNQDQKPREGIDVPFGGLKEKKYNYRCGNCGYEQEVPDFVVDEFAFLDDLETGVMPKLECGGCGGELECID